MRYTFNLKKAYDDYYLYSHNTVYGTGEKPRSEYVSPYKENYYIPEHNITKRMCYNKLGQLEDVEQELGVDLVKLLNAKKVYYMGWNRSADVLEIKETHKLFINLTNRTIEYYENEYSEFTFDLELKNYGKDDIYGGWALTREELENEKETS